MKIFLRIIIFLLLVVGWVLPLVEITMNNISNGLSLLEATVQLQTISTCSIVVIIVVIFMNYNRETQEEILENQVEIMKELGIKKEEKEGE